MTDAYKIIRDNSNAHWVALKGLQVGALVSLATAAAMPVMIQRGHSLAKTVACGILANGMAAGVPLIPLGFRHGLPQEPVKVEQVERYLDCYPVGYTALDKVEVFQVDLTEKWREWERINAHCGRWQSRSNGVALLALLPLAAAALSYRLQGSRLWQSRAVVASLALLSTVLSVLLWQVVKQVEGGLRTGQFVRFNLNRLIVQELEAKGELEEATENLLTAVGSFTSFYSPTPLKEGLKVGSQAIMQKENGWVYLAPLIKDV
ncbi:MAG: hypothetical protein AB7F31_06665 [Parachlamydiales bacterium]